MNIFQKQIDIINELSVSDILKDLKGENVPVSETQKLKILDSNDEEFTFERDLTDDEISYFRKWIKGEVQKGIKNQLGL